MLNKTIISLISILTLSQPCLCSHPSDMAPDRGGQTQLSCKFGRVERAGIAVVKDYGANTANPTLRFGVLVGADRHKTYTSPSTGKVLDYVNFFGGGCEKNDKYSTVTAAEETYEETGKALDISAKSLLQGQNPNYQGYAYSGDFAQTNTKGKNYTQLFFYRDDNASVSGITNAVTAANANNNLSHRFKETKKAYALSLQEILDRARTIYQFEAAGNHAAVQAENNYIFLTRGAGNGTQRTEVYLDPQYMRNLARDIARDGQNLAAICSRISGGLVQ